MKLFGLELDNLIKSNRARGFEIEGNDFLLLPDRLVPATSHLRPPHRVRVEGDRIVEVSGPAAHAADTVAKNYMYYKGGDLRFGKLTMSDTDLRLVDADPRTRSISHRRSTRTTRRGLLEEPAERRPAHGHARPGRAPAAAECAVLN